MNEIRQLAEPTRKALWTVAGFMRLVVSSADSVSPTAPERADTPGCRRSAARRGDPS